METNARLIYANDALRMIKDSKMDNPYISTMAEAVWDLAFDCAISCIEACEVVEVTHCQWIHTAVEDDWFGTFHKWTCSNCAFSTGHNPSGTTYCPACGAKMTGGSQDGKL